MLNKRILVPVDFSNCAIKALKYAVVIAKRMKAEIMIMNAFYVPLAHAELDSGAIVHGLESDAGEDIKKSFEALRDKVPELDEVPYDTITKYATVTDAVTSLCTSSHFDMIIMGTKGASGIEEVIIGTNAYAIIKEVNVPVIAVPDHIEPSNITKIALACDYKFMNENTLSSLTLIARLFGSEVHLFHVSEDRTITPEELEQAKKFERYFKNIRHKYDLVVNKDVEKGVEEYIQKNDIDLLALVPRKHNLFDRIFRGGESKSIIFHAKVPILALPE
ncbi:MAG: universal stress protein [Bacteroidota bacterium]